MKKLLVWILVAVVIGVAARWLWLRYHHRAVLDAENPGVVARVETVGLKRQSLAQTLEAFGVVAVAPSGEITIAAPYDCIVRKVYANPGAPLVAGDVLLEIDPSPDAKLSFDSARSVLALADKTLAATQERYNLQLATKQDLLAGQQAEEDAKLKVASFEARGLGGPGRITASANGVVSKIDLAAGTLAPAGTPLVTWSMGDQLEARLGVEAEDAAMVAAGQAVVLRSANRADGKNVSAVVRQAGHVLDAATGAAEVRVPVPAGATLLLGERVVGSIEVKRKEDALVVPRSAVLPDGGKEILFVVKNGKAVRHEVHPGVITAEQVEVSGEGLSEGDAVVTVGNYELADGMAVQLPGMESESRSKPLPEAKP